MLAPPRLLRNSQPANILRGSMTAAFNFNLPDGGIRLQCETPQALASDSDCFLTQLEKLGLGNHVESTPGHAETGFHLRAGLSQRWAPGLETLGLAAKLRLDTENRSADLEREILLTLLLGPVTFNFPSFAELASQVRIRCNIVRAARKTAVVFQTDAVDRPLDCWSHDDERGFTVRPGHALIAALQKATQPDASGKRYAFSCCRATEYVMLLAIAQELEASNPALLASLQRLWEQRAITAEEFRAVFLREHGSLEAPLPTGYYVPGDRVWFRNPDERSSDAIGYEGSWVLYLGSGLFTNFWTSGPSYTLRSKCLEIFQWRHAAYTDETGAVRINEAVVEERLKALALQPEEILRIEQVMLCLRDPVDFYQSGGCLDASREYARRVCVGTADLLLPLA